MSWTYSGNPAASDKDAVRFTITDTDSADPLVQDEEIAYSLASEGSVEKAAVALCRAIAAKFARLSTSKKVGTLQLAYEDRVSTFLALADTIEQKSNTLAIPYAGGLLKSEKEKAAEDTGAVHPIFFRGMMENHGG